MKQKSLDLISFPQRSVWNSLFHNWNCFIPGSVTLLTNTSTDGEYLVVRGMVLMHVPWLFGLQVVCFIVGLVRVERLEDVNILQRLNFLIA